MKLVVLVGGSGERLWPISRSSYPKQFIKYSNNLSLFQLTLLRNAALIEECLVVMNESTYFIAQDQVNELEEFKDIPTSYILEPFGKNTATAICLASMKLSQDDPVLVVPADHIIDDKQHYKSAIEQAQELANKNHLVTFGLKPSKPETGFGYIETKPTEHENHNTPSKVLMFHEKPNYETAHDYMVSGNYYWNSGMFCFKPRILLDELKAHSSDIFDQCQEIYKSFDSESELNRMDPEKLKSVRSESIDFAVMEHSKNLYVVPSFFPWSDLGSFDALYDYLEKDEKGNSIEPNTNYLESTNNFVWSSSRSINLIGVDSLTVADTEDALLICKRGDSQKVKELLTHLKKKSPNIVKDFPYVYKPWGSYTVLYESKNYKMKKILVKPNKRLSLQRHQYRSEHWIVVEGEACVTCGDNIFTLAKNNATFIPQTEIHRLENKNTENLVIIEIQLGSYLGEDDIERIEDDFNRQ